MEGQLMMAAIEEVVEFHNTECWSRLAFNMTDEGDNHFTFYFEEAGIEVKVNFEISGCFGMVYSAEII